MNTAVRTAPNTFANQSIRMTEELIDEREVIGKLQEEYKLNGIRFVTIAPIDKQTKKKDTSFRKLRDPNTNKTYCIPIKINPDGTFVGKRIRIKGGRIYDITNFDQAWEFYIASKSPYVIGGLPGAGNPKLYRVVDERKESNELIENANKMVDAMNFINNLTQEQKYDFALPFGIHKAGNSDFIINKKLVEIAMKTPNRIIDKFRNPAYTNAEIVFKRGVDAQLIKFITNQGYFYKGSVNLGADDATACKFLLNNPPTLNIINAESNQILYKIGAATDLKFPNVKAKAVEKTEEDLQDEETVNAEVAEIAIDPRKLTELARKGGPIEVGQGGIPISLQMEHEQALHPPVVNDDVFDAPVVSEVADDNGGIKTNTTRRETVIQEPTKIEAPWAQGAAKTAEPIGKVEEKPTPAPKPKK